MGAIKNTYKNTIVHDTSQLTIHTVNSMRPVLSRVMVKLVTTVTDPLLIRLFNKDLEISISLIRMASAKKRLVERTRAIEVGDLWYLAMYLR